MADRESLVDVRRPMTAKDRRIARRREENRMGHTIRCAKTRGAGPECNCNQTALRDWAKREKAFGVTT